MISKKKTVGVLGAGHVGAHVAYALGIMGVADVVKLVDKNSEKLTSEVQDLRDAVWFMPHRVVYEKASPADLGDCDVLISAVGDISLVATGSRDDELEFTARQVKELGPKVKASGFSGILINITNPCDVITSLWNEYLGLPRGRVLGTGTCLDSSRLVSAISQHSNLEHHSYFVFLMGEHGEAQMAPWSLFNFFGKPLAELEKEKAFSFDRDKAEDEAIHAGWVTYSGKHCTEYGICSAAAALARTVLHDEKRIYPVSAPLDGEYGEKGIYIGVPSVIGAGGVERVMEFTLSKEEKELFKTCCDRVRKNIAKGRKLAME